MNSAIVFCGLFITFLACARLGEAFNKDCAISEECLSQCEENENTLCDTRCLIQCNIDEIRAAVSLKVQQLGSKAEALQNKQEQLAEKAKGQTEEEIEEMSGAIQTNLEEKKASVGEAGSGAESGQL